MAAETGSGKTGAFSLPVIQAVWETKNGGGFIANFSLLAFIANFSLLAFIANFSLLAFIGLCVEFTSTF